MQLLQALCYLSLDNRRDILLLCRCRTPLLVGSTLHRNLKTYNHPVSVPVLPCHTPEQVVLTTIQFYEFLSHHMESFLSYTESSIIMHACRIAPGNPEEVHEAIEKAFVKEFSAAVGKRDIGVTFDFRSILSEDPRDRQIPLSSRLPPMETTAQSIHDSFLRVRQRLAGKIFYPSLGQKTVGLEVQRNFREEYANSGCTFMDDGSRFDWNTISPACLERFYAETGRRVEGPVEMRQAYKYTDLKPRVYYARGGDVLQSSIHIQPIMNQIVDHFPECHRTTRFAPPEDEYLGDHDICLTYDYSSFTSSLDPVVPFVEALSKFFRGTSIFLVDVHKGLLETDLGELFSDYNRECNDGIPFSIERMEAKILSALNLDSSIYYHTCGMLGVEGNIFIATLLHAIHTRFMAGFGRSKCVGDDARLHLKVNDTTASQGEIEYWQYLLESLGDVEISKSAIFDAVTNPMLQAYNFVKRPIMRAGEFMTLQDTLILPSVVDAFNIDDGLHTVFPSGIPPHVRCFRQICRFISKLTFVREEIDDMPLLAMYVNPLMHWIRRTDPHGKDGVRRSHGDPYALPPVDKWGFVTYEQWLSEDMLYDELVKLPKFASSTPQLVGWVGEVVEGRMTKKVGHLEKLGYVKAELVFEEYGWINSGALFPMLLSREYDFAYSFTTLLSFPSWYAYLP